MPNVTIGGKTFNASDRTIAHLRATEARLKERHPDARLRIIQATFSDGPYSAGTHDEDCVFDLEIVGLSWLEAQAFLRWTGWAAWWRHTGTWASSAAWHIHMVSIPTGLPDHPTEAQVAAAFTRLGQQVGTYVPGQVRDYMASPPRDGLKGHALDSTPHPPDINAVVFKGTVVEEKPVAPVPQVPTISDIVVSLKRFRDRSANPKAVGRYNDAIATLADIESGTRVKVPTSVAEARAALRTKLANGSLTKEQNDRIESALDLLNGI